MSSQHSQNEQIILRSSVTHQIVYNHNYVFTSMPHTDNVYIYNTSNTSNDSSVDAIALSCKFIEQYYLNSDTIEIKFYVVHIPSFLAACTPFTESGELLIVQYILTVNYRCTCVFTYSSPWKLVFMHGKCDTSSNVPLHNIQDAPMGMFSWLVAATSMRERCSCVEMMNGEQSVIAAGTIERLGLYVVNWDMNMMVNALNHSI